MPHTRGGGLLQSKSEKPKRGFYSIEGIRDETGSRRAFQGPAQMLAFRAEGWRGRGGAEHFGLRGGGSILDCSEV